MVGKKRCKVNINDFKFSYNCSVKDINWQHSTTAEIAGFKLDIRLPYMPKTNDTNLHVDLHKSKIESFGWVNDRAVNGKKAPNVWWGILRTHRKNPNYLMLLERDFERGNDLKKFVQTPPGRPGNPMTILIDGVGNIVRNLYFPLGSSVKLFFLDHNWDGFGWNLFYPVIALQFLSGEFKGTDSERKKWDEYLMRN